MAAGASASQPASRPAATTQSAPVDRAFSNRPLRTGRGGGLPTLSDSDRPNVLGRMLAYAVVILVLGTAAVFVTKRYLPRVRSASGRGIRMVNSVYLGPRKQVHVLQVGSQRFLVASCRDNVSLVSELSGSFADVYDKTAAMDASQPEQAAGGAAEEDRP